MARKDFKKFLIGLSLTQKYLTSDVEMEISFEYLAKREILLVMAWIYR